VECSKVYPAAAEFSFFYCSDGSDLILVLTHESSQMKGYELILKSEQNIQLFPIVMWYLLLLF
jgi:hypothetical protein